MTDQPDGWREHFSLELRVNGRRLDHFLRELGLELRHHPKHHGPRQLVLLEPIFTDLTTGEIVMADTGLPLNQTWTAVITRLNPTTGTLDPVPATEVFTPTVTDTANMSATIAPFVPPANATPAQTALAGAQAVTVGWLHTVAPLLIGVGMTLNDSGGDIAFSRLFDMLPPNATPDQLGVDDTDAVFATVPTPV